MSDFAKVFEFSLAAPAEGMRPESKQAAALLLLDTLGVTIGAHPMEAGVIARQTAKALYGAGTSDGAPILLDGKFVSRAGSAFAAATQTDNLDAHDGYNPTKGHIGVAAIPALYAIAHDMPDLSGSDALAALIVCYEVAGRAGIALHDSVSDYHTSGAWNGLGVAAMVARLRGLTEDQLRHAFGIAEYHGPRSQMMREIANPTMLHDGSGMGALVGISAAMMAEIGFTGAPALTVEADGAAEHWADLGDFWQIEHQYIKPYPICRWAHAAIDAVSALRAEHNLTADQIARIEVRSFRNAASLFAGLPETTSQAQYSLPFAVAIMAVHGRIGLEHISGDGLTDAAVADLTKCTTAVETAQHEERFPTGRWADVTIHLTDGTALTSPDTHARGGPEHPMDQSEVEAKFFSLATPVIGQDRATALRDATLALTDGGTFGPVAVLLKEAP